MGWTALGLAREPGTGVAKVGSDMLPEQNYSATSLAGREKEACLAGLSTPVLAPNPDCLPVLDIAWSRRPGHVGQGVCPWVPDFGGPLGTEHPLGRRRARGPLFVCAPGGVAPPQLLSPHGDVARAPHLLCGSSSERLTGDSDSFLPKTWVLVCGNGVSQAPCRQEPTPSSPAGLSWAFLPTGL